MLVDKYRPKSIVEMVGNEDSRLAVLRWLTNWQQGSKPMLIIGPPGVGKTTLVKALANDLAYEVIELNASDERTKDRLESIIKPLFTNTNIYSRKVLLFLDEVDGIHGNYDKGGFNALLNLLNSATIPVIMAANDDSNENMKELKRVCNVVRFKRIPPRLLMLYLEHVLKQEGIDVSIGDRVRVVSESYGDVRTMLNKAQAVIDEVYTATPKSYAIPIEEAMSRFFSASNISDAIDALRRSEGFYSDPRFYHDSEDRRLDKLHAIYTSIVNSNKDIDSMAKMLDALSYADILVSIINSKRRWDMLRYLDALIARSIFYASRGIAYAQYDMPYNLSSKIFNEGKVIRDIAEGLAKVLHESLHNIKAYYIPYLMLILSNKKDYMRSAIESGMLPKDIKVLLN
jgi:replication factor C large subunit